MDGPTGLTLAELIAGSPPPPSSFQADEIMRVVVSSELKAGRLIERGSYFALRPEALEPDQVDALRGLKLGA